MQVHARNMNSHDSPVHFYDEKHAERKPKTIIKLCSQRLLPTRHQTKNAILSILHDGEVIPYILLLIK